MAKMKGEILWMNEVSVVKYEYISSKDKFDNDDWRH